MLPAGSPATVGAACGDVESALHAALEAVAASGVPSSSTVQWSIPRADAIDLIAALESRHPRDAPIRILEVGTFVGISSLLMLQCFPNATLDSVDPNLPLRVEFEAMRCRGMEGNLGLRTQQLASKAAERLGVRDRLHLHAGGFATSATFAGGLEDVPVIGPAVVAARGPFDAIFVDGLHHEQAVLADLRLAIGALRPGQGMVLLHDLVGSWGSNVRRAVYRSLEEHDDLSLIHPPYAHLYRSIGRLQSGPTTGSTEDRVATLLGQSMDAISEAIARGIGGVVGHARPQRADAASRRVAEILDRGGAGGVPVMIALGCLDDLPPAEVRRRLSRWAESVDAMVLGFTPPGEERIAGPWSRPLARRVRELSSVGFDAFDRLVPFLEPFVYAMGSAPVVELPGSLLSTSVIALRRDSAAHRRLVEDGVHPLDEESARRLDDLRTQLAHHREFIRRERRDHQQTSAMLAAQQRELAEMSRWRIHLGRHRFWRTGGRRS